MAEGMRQGDQEAVVRLTTKIVGHTHFEVRSTPEQNEGNVVLAVGVSLTQFIGPQDGSCLLYTSDAADE